MVNRKRIFFFLQKDRNFNIVLSAETTKRGSFYLGFYQKRVFLQDIKQIIYTQWVKGTCRKGRFLQKEQVSA